MFFSNGKVVQSVAVIQLNQVDLHATYPHFLATNDFEIFENFPYEGYVCDGWDGQPKLHIQPMPWPAERLVNFSLQQDYFNDMHEKVTKSGQPAASPSAASSSCGATSPSTVKPPRDPELARKRRSGAVAPGAGCAAKSPKKNPKKCEAAHEEKDDAADDETP